MIIKPDIVHGRNIGYLLAILTSGLAVSLWWLGSQLAQDEWEMVVRLGGGIIFCFALYIVWQTWCFSRLSYEIGEGRLIVHHGWQQTEYSLHLARLVPTAEYDHVASFAGLRWPGCFWGQGRAVTAAGESVTAVFYATRPLAQQTLIQTQEEIIGLSPPDGDIFMSLLEVQSAAVIRELRPDSNLEGDLVSPSPSESAATGSHISAVSALPLHIALPLGLNLLAWLLAGTVMFLRPTVAPVLSFGLDGMFALSEPLPTAVWLALPFVGLVIAGGDLLLASRLQKDHPELARLLWGTACLVQVVLLLAPLFAMLLPTQ